MNFDIKCWNSLFSASQSRSVQLNMKSVNFDPKFWISNFSAPKSWTRAVQLDLNPLFEFQSQPVQLNMNSVNFDRKFRISLFSTYSNSVRNAESTVQLNMIKVKFDIKFWNSLFSARSESMCAVKYEIREFWSEILNFELFSFQKLNKSCAVRS